jgi:hypothetical protein
VVHISANERLSLLRKDECMNLILGTERKDFYFLKMAAVYCLKFVLYINITACYGIITSFMSVVEMALLLTFS